MSRLLSLALCCLLVPAVGRAQEPATSEPVAVQETAQGAFPELDSAPRPDGSAPRTALDVPLREEATPSVDKAAPTVTTHSGSERGQATRRVLMEVLAGSGGWLVGGFLGRTLYVDVLRGRCFDCSHDYTRPIFLGAGPGSGLGVYAAGRLMGGEGGFLGTMAGAVLGTGSAFLLLETDDGPSTLARELGTALMPLAGAIFAYEISNALAGSPPSPSPGGSGEAPSLVPVASTTKEGGVLGGLVGRF
jgi:hypothetical protein